MARAWGIRSVNRCGIVLASEMACKIQSFPRIHSAVPLSVICASDQTAFQGRRKLGQSTKTALLGVGSHKPVLVSDLALRRSSPLVLLVRLVKSMASHFFPPWALGQCYDVVLYGGALEMVVWVRPAAICTRRSWGGFVGVRISSSLRSSRLGWNVTLQASLGLQAGANLTQPSCLGESHGWSC